MPRMGRSGTFAPVGAAPGRNTVGGTMDERTATAMFSTRFHGRGGQGVVTAAEMLAVAAFLDGSFAQAFPSFGSERMGAPVVSYCRVSAGPIRTHEPVENADAVVIQDPTLLHEVDLFAGLGGDGYVLINSSRAPAELGLADLETHLRPGRLVTLPANEIGQRFLGRPRANTALLAALAALTGVASVNSVTSAIRRRFGGPVGEANAAAAEAAVRSLRRSQVVTGRA